MKPQATSPAATGSERFRLPDGSRSAESPWVWRGFLFMSLIALGLSITFAAGAQLFYAIAWAVITAGWFATAMWLWRKHFRYEEAARLAHQHGRLSPRT